jgi:CheY-like chemotaxis protein
MGTSKGMPKRILLIDVDEFSQDRRAAMLRQRGVDVTCADDVEHARLLWQEDTYNLVMIDAKNIHDDAIVFYQSIKDKRPKQMVKFLVGKPALLADAPLEGEIPTVAARKTPILKDVQAFPGSHKGSPGTGINGASSQILKLRSQVGFQSTEPSTPKPSIELSFGDAVSHARGQK